MNAEQEKGDAETIEIAAATPTDVRHSRRASFGAAFGYGCALVMAEWGWFTTPEVEEFERTARLERTAYDELERRSSSR